MQTALDSKLEAAFCQVFCLNAGAPQTDNPYDSLEDHVDLAGQ
jgi:hypothetical protein